MKLEIICGDITELKVDAIVNAANPTLLGGGGVDGAINRRAGRFLYEECEKIPEISEGTRLMPGNAVITKGYNLPAKHVIHAVGPNYLREEKPQEILYNAYFNSLRIAEEKNIKSIAFPSISTGVYGYPFKESLNVVKNVIDNFDYNTLKNIKLCYYSSRDFLEAKEFFSP